MNSREQLHGLVLHPRFIFALSLCLFAAFQAAADTPPQIALSHVTVVDARDGSKKSDMTVLLSAGRITAVGPSSKIHIPKRAHVIDARGKFLIPGLWDMHIHSEGDQRALRSLVNWGITGARDMGGNITNLTEARRKIASGDWVGPRLLIAGPALMGPPAETDEDVWVLRSPDEARRAIDSLAEQHVDFVKVHDGLAKDTFEALVAAAKAKRLTFAGHVPASMTTAEVSDLGQKSIEHLEFVPKPCLVLFQPATVPPAELPPGCDPRSMDALLKHLAKNGTWLDPTIQGFRYFAPGQWDSIFAGFQKFAIQIRQNRVSILAGTDWSSFLEGKGASPGGSLHDELELLVRAGFTSTEALRAATWNPVLFLGFSDSLGTVEIGKIANLVLLDADPLKDIGNTKRISAVLLEGRLLRSKSNH